MELCLQKHIDSNADITVSCVPMDDRYVCCTIKHTPTHKPAKQTVL